MSSYQTIMILTMDDLSGLQSLVGGIPTPLRKKWSSSVGIILPNIWKNEIRVPNHQPDE